MRCSWVNLNNSLYVKYHDLEWGVPSYDDNYLFEMLILETMQAGLAWETILKKRENFQKALDNFDVIKIAKYKEEKKKELLANEGLIRNKRKIESIINNAQVFLKIKNEFGTFSKYIWSFSQNKILYHEYQTTNSLSDKIAKDLKKRGMTFVGSTIIYSYLQAIGIIDDHEKTCEKYVD